MRRHLHCSSVLKIDETALGPEHTSGIYAAVDCASAVQDGLDF